MWVYLSIWGKFWFLGGCGGTTDDLHWLLTWAPILYLQAGERGDRQTGRVAKCTILTRFLPAGDTEPVSGTAWSHPLDPVCSPWDWSKQSKTLPITSVWQHSLHVPEPHIFRPRPIATLSLPLHIFCYSGSRTEKAKPVANRWLHQLSVHSREPVNQNIHSREPIHHATLGVASLKPHHRYLNCLRRLDSIFPCSALSQLSQSKVRNGAFCLLLQEGNRRNLPGWQTGRCPWDECSSQPNLYLIIYGLELPLQESKTIPTSLAKQKTYYLFSYIYMPVPVDIPSLSQEGVLFTQSPLAYHCVPPVNTRHKHLLAWVDASWPNLFMALSNYTSQDLLPCNQVSLHQWVTKGSWGCRTESTVHLLCAWDARGNYFSICWYFWPCRKNNLSHELCQCYCPRVIESPCYSWERGWGGGSGLTLQSIFSHHLPEQGSHHPQRKKGLIIPLPASREFCIHSALWAFTPPWPRRVTTAAPISSGMMPSAPYPQAAVNQSATKQLVPLPPPWLELWAKWLFNWHTSRTLTSPSI